MYQLVLRNRLYINGRRNFRDISFTLCVDMAGGSIELFQYNRNYCEAIGIKLPASHQNRFKFSAVNLIFIVCTTELIVVVSAFLLYDATSLDEFGVNWCALICITLGLFNYFIFIWKMEDILKFTECCEAFIEKRMVEM